jgi:mono/diheme cytochrome c family protein
MDAGGTRRAPRSLPKAWRRALVAAALATLGAAALWTAPAARAVGGGGSVAEAGRERGDVADAEDAGQAARGAAVYAFSCAACHGATGRGFAEAVAAFPADYRDCARCHQPTNAPQMPGSQVGLATMAFSLGDPPALAEPGRLARFGTAGALHRYLRAAMPRWAPGSLDDDAYLDLTAHLLRMIGALGEAEALEREGLDARPLR